ncbi:AsnC-like helix-turn-helix protein [Rhizobium sp. PP-F2F-G48]|nr:AsnC-like helix-turn-helix protein [Rhizobium sp. PP-F2F-G48]
MQALPEVISCHLVSGEVQVVVSDLDCYERFLLGTLLKLPGISDIRSDFYIQTVRVQAPLRWIICQTGKCRVSASCIPSQVLVHINFNADHLLPSNQCLLLDLRS